MPEIDTILGALVALLSAREGTWWWNKYKERRNGGSKSIHKHLRTLQDQIADQNKALEVHMASDKALREAYLEALEANTRAVDRIAAGIERSVVEQREDMREVRRIADKA